MGSDSFKNLCIEELAHFKTLNADQEIANNVAYNESQRPIGTDNGVVEDLFGGLHFQ